MRVAASRATSIYCLCRTHAKSSIFLEASLTTARPSKPSRKVYSNSCRRAGQCTHVPNVYLAALLSIC